MSNNPNNINLVGNLTADPELRFTTSGTAVVNFRMAVTQRIAPSNGNQDWTDKTTFMNVVAWRGQAENIAASVAKGDRVMVSGYLQTREYTPADGVKQYFTEVVAQEVGVALRWALVAEVERSTSTKELQPATADRIEDEEPF